MMKTKTKIKTPQEMFEEKQERIEKYVSDKDMAIRVSWAINVAVSVLSDVLGEKPKDTKRAIERIDEIADAILTLYRKHYSILQDRRDNARARELEMVDETEIELGEEAWEEMSPEERKLLG